MVEPVKYVGPDSSPEMGTLAAGGSQAVSGYATTANDIGLTLPTNPADGIRLTYEGAQVTLIPQGGTKGVVAQMADGAVNYPDFFGKGMSLRYTPLLSGVKEDIILRSYTGVNTFTFLLNTGGLGLYEENGRYYVAGSPDAETPIELGDLVTFDAHGRFSVGTTTAETLTPNQSYRLTLTVDEAFLTDENTTYPVTIDPTLEIENSAIHDATIYSGTPNMNANWTYLHAGYYDSTYKVARTLFRFADLGGSSMYASPSQFSVASAEFHIREATGSAPVEVGLYANTSDYYWVESTVTWNNAYLSVGTKYQTGSPGYENETTYDITDLVSAWRNGDENEDAGFVLISSNETSVDKAFYSSEWSSSTYRPYLVIEFYTATAGLNRSVMDLNVGQTGYLNVTGISGTVTWTSSNPSVATIASSGAVVGHKAGTAIITANVPGEAPMSCTVYVKIPDAVYYITANTGKTLAVDGSLNDATPVKLVTKSDVSGHAKLRQLWKIRYVGNGYYGIRSLYKSDKVLGKSDGTSRIFSAGNTDHITSFDNGELWKIEQIGSGYVLQNYLDVSSNKCLKPLSSIAVTVPYVQGDGTFIWTLTPDTTVPDLMILIDADTCLPAHGALKSLPLRDSANLEDLNLIVSYISQFNNTTNYYWQVSDPSIATVTGPNNRVTALSRGETTISLHASTSTNTPMYFTLCVSSIGYPDVYEKLIGWECISLEGCAKTGDGLLLSTTPLSEILIHKGVTSLPKNTSGTENWSVANYYDDWYLFAVEDESIISYGLYKMREEESDDYDGNDPGVTISFVALDSNALISCLNSPTLANRYTLFSALQKVTGPDTYAHDEIIAYYFSRTESKGAYLIAEKYTMLIANTASNRLISVPTQCRSAINSKPRISDALSDINTAAGYDLYRESDMTLLINSPSSLTLLEKQAILTCFTANVTFNSFAAEVQFHAQALDSWEADIPFVGDEWYERALRADMAIGEEYESGFYDDYYDLTSDIVQNQARVHGTY